MAQGGEFAEEAGLFDSISYFVTDDVDGLEEIDNVRT